MMSEFQWFFLVHGWKRLHPNDPMYLTREEVTELVGYYAPTITEGSSFKVHGVLIATYTGDIR